MQNTVRVALAVWLGGLLALSVPTAQARDLDEIRAADTPRHLGIPYAIVVTGAGDGLDVKLIRGFARRLGVRYEFVPGDWSTVFGDLIGVHARRAGAERFGSSPVRGDLIANGMTILDWRERMVRFSRPTFRSGVWLVARADSQLSPIVPTGQLGSDVAVTKASLDGVSVLALANTCLDPGLYRLEATRADIQLTPNDRKLNETVPALLNHDAETTPLDLPDALIALKRWPGEVKVIGPISSEQHKAVAFPPNADALREAFNDYFAGIVANGSYEEMVRQYYPVVFDYLPTFFSADAG